MFNKVIIIIISILFSCNKKASKRFNSKNQTSQIKSDNLNQNQNIGSSNTSEAKFKEHKNKLILPKHKETGICEQLFFQPYGKLNGVENIFIDGVIKNLMVIPYCVDGLIYNFKNYLGGNRLVKFLEYQFRNNPEGILTSDPRNYNIELVALIITSLEIHKKIDIKNLMLNKIFAFIYLVKKFEEQEKKLKKKQEKKLKKKQEKELKKEQEKELKKEEEPKQEAKLKNKYEIKYIMDFIENNPGFFSNEIKKTDNTYIPIIKKYNDFMTKNKNIKLDKIYKKLGTKSSIIISPSKLFNFLLFKQVNMSGITNNGDEKLNSLDLLQMTSSVLEEKPDRILDTKENKHFFLNTIWFLQVVIMRTLYGKINVNEQEQLNNFKSGLWLILKEKNHPIFTKDPAKTTFDADNLVNKIEKLDKNKVLSSELLYIYQLKYSNIYSQLFIKYINATIDLNQDPKNPDLVSFYDCVESTIMSLVNFALYNPKTQTFDISKIKINGNDKNKKLKKEIQKFYKEYDTIKKIKHNLKNSHNKWAQIVSLKKYVFKYNPKHDSYEILPNEENVTNFLSIIFSLNDEEQEQKEQETNIDKTKKYEKYESIFNEYLKLFVTDNPSVSHDHKNTWTFKENDSPIFRVMINSGHAEIERISKYEIKEDTLKNVKHYIKNNIVYANCYLNELDIFSDGLNEVDTFLMLTCKAMLNSTRCVNFISKTNQFYKDKIMIYNFLNKRFKKIISKQIEKINKKNKNLLIKNKNLGPTLTDIMKEQIPIKLIEEKIKSNEEKLSRLNSDLWSKKWDIESEFDKTKAKELNIDISNIKKQIKYKKDNIAHLKKIKAVIQEIENNKRLLFNFYLIYPPKSQEIFYQYDMSKKNFYGLDFSNHSVLESKFNNSKFYNCKFSPKNTYESNIFNSCKFTETIFNSKKDNFKDCTFINVNFKGKKFEKCTFEACKFIKCIYDNDNNKPNFINCKILNNNRFELDENSQSQIILDSPFVSGQIEFVGNLPIIKNKIDIDWNTRFELSKIKNIQKIIDFKKNQMLKDLKLMLNNATLNDKQLKDLTNNMKNFVFSECIFQNNINQNFIINYENNAKFYMCTFINLQITNYLNKFIRCTFKGKEIKFNELKYDGPKDSTFENISLDNNVKIEETLFNDSIIFKNCVYAPKPNPKAIFRLYGQDKRFIIEGVNGKLYSNLEDYFTYKGDEDDENDDYRIEFRNFTLQNFDFTKLKHEIILSEMILKKCTFNEKNKISYRKSTYSTLNQVKGLQKPLRKFKHIDMKFKTDPFLKEYEEILIKVLNENEISITGKNYLVQEFENVIFERRFLNTDYLAEDYKIKYINGTTPTKGEKDAFIKLGIKPLDEKEEEIDISK